MDRRGRAVVGYKVSESNPVGDCVPLTISRSPARLYLSVLHTLELDDSETFLTTKQEQLHAPGGRRHGFDTHVRLREGAAQRIPRGTHPYPRRIRHPRQDAACEWARQEQAGRSPPARRGRRFRRCLEDIIEFCILERLATPRDGWKSALNRSRDEYLDQQLRAAVHRNPVTAADALKRDGWQVIEPDT